MTLHELDDGVEIYYSMLPTAIAGEVGLYGIATICTYVHTFLRVCTYTDLLFSGSIIIKPYFRVFYWVWECRVRPTKKAFRNIDVSDVFENGVFRYTPKLPCLIFFLPNVI